MEKQVFGQSIRNYIEKYMKFYVTLGVGIIIILILTFILQSKDVTTLDAQKIAKLLRLIRFFTYGYYVFISYLIARSLYNNFKTFEFLVFGQGLMTGIGCGIITSLLMSIFGFITAFVVGQPLEAVWNFFGFIIDFTLFIYSLLFAILIDIIIGILWMNDTYAKSKQANHDTSKQE